MREVVLESGSVEQKKKKESARDKTRCKDFDECHQVGVSVLFILSPTVIASYRLSLPVLSAEPGELDEVVE